MPHFYIGGVNGVGKTVICKEVATVLDIPHITGSSIVMKTVGVSNHAELSQVDIAPYTEAIKRAFLDTYQAVPSMILDGHYNLEDDEVPFFDHFIILMATPERIQQQRLLDSGRRRDCVLQHIQEEIDQLYNRAQEAQIYYRIHLNPIWNDDSVQVVSKRIIDLIAPTL